MTRDSNHVMQIDLPAGRFGFCVVNLGCKVNRVESDTISAALMARGGIPADEEHSDIVFVNTCTVTGEADKKARKAVRHALKTARTALVYVTGCGVAIDPESYAALDERVRVIGKTDLMLQLSTQPERTVRFGDDFRTRLNIKVQDGCDRACTYCIVHVARGPARSMAYDSVLAEARLHLEQGVKEIVLAGIDLGSYRDGQRKLEHLVGDLVELCESSARPGEVPARVRASSLEPVTVDEGFVDLLATLDGKLCRHVHVPLQSGSTKVLREMARPYTAEDFASLVNHLRDRVPGISITTDIIVGFPGETDEDFARSVEMAQKCGFSKIHVFPYSKRAGTPAAARIDQIDSEVKLARAQHLRAVSDSLRRNDLARRAGTTELCIIEPTCALTESYHEIPAPHGAAVGQLVPIVIPKG